MPTFFIIRLMDNEFAYHPIKDNIANQRITRAIAFIISTPYCLYFIYPIHLLYVTYVSFISFQHR